MAGLVPAIHALGTAGKDVDARDKPGHDEAGQDGCKGRGRALVSFLPTICCINKEPIPQMLGQFRPM